MDIDIEDVKTTLNVCALITALLGVGAGAIPLWSAYQGAREDRRKAKDGELVLLRLNRGAMGDAIAEENARRADERVKAIWCGLGAAFFAALSALNAAIASLL